VPKRNLRDLIKIQSDSFIDLLEYKATISLHAQYTSEMNGRNAN